MTTPIALRASFLFIFSWLVCVGFTHAKNNFHFYSASAIVADTLFTDDFESGSFDLQYWTVNQGPNNGLVAVTNDLIGTSTAYSGEFAAALGKTSDNGGYNINSLDLELDLSGQSDVFLSYWISDFNEGNDPQDGIYFSDDGGQSFVKVFNLSIEWWNNIYGQLPPLSVDRLAEQYGLEMNATFVVRFQQAGIHDFIGSNSDGMFLDDVSVYSSAPNYASNPYSTSFEGGELPENWRWAYPYNTENANFIRPGGRVEVRDWNDASNTGAYGLVIGRRNDGDFTVNAADLYLDLSDLDEVELRFWLK